MRLKFIGTGNAAGVPAYGCDCPACARARVISDHQRGPCSAALLVNNEVTLIDAGNLQLAERYPAGSFARCLLTHYHMDHVQGLFPIRWGVSKKIPVYGPADEQGCDDLFKHPGILDFSETLTAFVPLQFDNLTVTPLSLNHSRPCLGYAFEYDQKRLAYLTDTVGLPPETEQFLAQWRADVIVLDCSSPPKQNTPRNHNDFTLALSIHQQLSPGRTYLTHISHHLDNWLNEQDDALPPNLHIARDNQVIEIG